MIHVLKNNKTILTNIAYDTTTQATVKCLHFIKTVLQLDVKMGIYDSSSTNYQALIQMTQTKSFIELKGKIFLPIFKKNKSIWGFIEINYKSKKPTLVKVKKALQTIKDMIEPELETPLNDFSKNNLNYSLLVFGGTFENNHKIASNIFQNKKFTSFINLTEWIQQDDLFSLKTLCEFSDNLLFVPEVLNLNLNQRSILALYSILPDQLKKSSLIACTKTTFKNLSSLIKDEKGFLSAFSKRKVHFNKYF